MRRAGILLPVASLPSDYGIGCFSKEAYNFVDALESAGQRCWQILPLGPTSYGDSPYSSFSTFAGNPYFIDPDALVEKGWLKKDSLLSYDFGKNVHYIDYGKIYKARFPMLREAFKNSGIEASKAFQDFVEENSGWLKDYALFMAIKDENGGRAYLSWDKDLRLRKKEALTSFEKEHGQDILFYEFLQFEFAEEWEKLRAYANEKGIKIIGDIPIYVAMDSADSWANPSLFQFDEDQNPIAVAGCPPDAFSKTGQLWGNPLYNWEYHKETAYEWWIERLKRVFSLYDIVRIDHFRGFDAYYSIPYGEKTAVNGKWEKGPGYDLFKRVKEVLGEREVIAEDLGYITKSVKRLTKRTGFPGMKVLQFAFDSREESDYLPHNYEKNSVVYTGTHDNDTLLGWYKSIIKRDRDYADSYLNIKGLDEKEIPWAFIRAAYGSVSELCIVPMQDYLSLGTEARTNLPSTLGENWKWRMGKKDFTKKLMTRIKKLVDIYRRSGE